MTSRKGWRPTPAHLRAVLGSLFLCATAILASRPDLLVIASPLVAAAVWAIVVRPRAEPTVDERVTHSVLTEGQATTRSVQVSDPEGRVDNVAVVFEQSTMIDQRPVSGQLVVSLPDDGDRPLEAELRPTRWGCYRVMPALVVASSGWNAFRHVSQNWSAVGEILTFPRSGEFDAAAPAVQTPGLVGVNRSPRDGTGNEFAKVRPFQPGDRLRRIHWAESLRSGTLHVTSTWADHDRNVILVVDAFEDSGESEGVDGEASSLDIAVRAAAAIAEHYIRVGDRVSVVPLGAGVVQRLAPGAGRGHLRRILEVLARISPAQGLMDTGRMPRGLSPGALVIVLSPLLSAGAQQRVMTMSDHGFNVLAIDCLPPTPRHSNDVLANIAGRIARLEREARLRRVSSAGVPVLPWRGPGSLDSVLRGLHRRPTAGVGQS
jgi:uncharacterized protein (DUF58 family)